jgi:RNA polymerase sigma factor (sigma-70 family)
MWYASATRPVLRHVGTAPAKAAYLGVYDTTACVLDRGSRPLGWPADSSTVPRRSVIPVGGDAQLAAQFAAGDPDAVRAVYQTYGRLVYSVAFKVLGDVGLAEDATQQTFVQAWRAADSYDPTRALGPWLASIARRAAIDVYRRTRRHQTHYGLDSADASLVSPPPSAEQIYEVWEVRRAIDALPPDDRELVRLQHFLGLSHAEIADRLKIPVGTVKSRTFRVHRRLLGRLGHLRGETDDAVVGIDHSPARQTQTSAKEVIPDE